MAIIERRVCDVFQTDRNIAPVRVHLATVDPADNTVEHELMERVVDLCPRAIKRLRKCIERGCAPPPPRNRGAVPTEDETAGD